MSTTIATTEIAGKLADAQADSAAAAFVEVIVEIDRATAEPLSDALLEAGALSASIEDADAGTLDEQPLFGEPGTEPETAAWNHSRIVALFNADANIDAILDEAIAAAGLASLPPVTRRAVADADWVRLTQSQFDPIPIGKRLWIVPSWHLRPEQAGADAIVLQLDPGLAFGTGSHPTTRLCLCWLEENLKTGTSVIDYGCGSGILAIAAKKLGAARVLGTDIDPQAITASNANTEENGFAIAGAEGLDFVLSTHFQAEPAEVVVANILSSPLKLLAPLLCGLVAPGGSLVLSGVLERQWEEVAAAYQAMIKLEVWGRDEGWVCLAGTRPWH